MELNNLKTGLWGFKKQDVCEYIAKMSEELTAKMEQERRQNEEKLDAIVTDQALPEEYNSFCQDHGIRVMTID